MANNQSIQFLRGTSANKKAAGTATILLAGQPFYETDTHRLYIGDGSTALDTLKHIDGSVYDTVIGSQEEFEEWYKELDANTYSGESVLILSGTCTRSDGKGLHLPATLKQLHGLGTVEINITNFTYSDTNKGGIWYTTAPTTNEYSIENISLKCTGGTTRAPAIGFNSCINLTNCTGTGTSSFIISSRGDYGYGFYLCTNLTNCTGTGNAYSTGGSGRGFYSCTNLTNCTGTGTSSDSTGGSGHGFYSCEICSNCRQTPGTSSTTSTWGGNNEYISKDTCPGYVDQ